MRKFLFISILSIVFFLNFLPVKDPDFGWHYRCGYELLQGHPCLSNTFTYFLADYHAFYPSFIYDALTAVIYNTFGFLGLSFIHALTISGAFYLFYKLSRQNIILAAVVFSIVTFLSGGTLGLGWRPQIITFFLILIGYWIIGNNRFIKLRTIQFRSVYLYPLLMLLWVNTHIGFFTGLVLYGIYWLESCIYWFRKKITNRDIMTITCIGIMSFLATLLNPFGYNVYIELYRHLISPLNKMIAEWVPSPLFFKLLIIIIGLSVLIRQIKVKNISLFKLTLLFVFGALSFQANRNLPLFFIFASIFLLQNLPRKKLTHIYDMALPIFVAILISTLFIRVKYTISFDRNWEEYCTKGATNYPCLALKKYPHLSGNVFAAYEWGGFLIWQRPDLKVFSDGRMPAWHDENGESPYQVFLKILQTQPGWNEKLRKHKTDFLILSKGTFLDLLLRTDQKKFGWNEVYNDDSHAIYENILTYSTK